MKPDAQQRVRNRLSFDVLAVLFNRFVVFGVALLLASARGHYLGTEAFGIFSVGVMLPTLLATVFNLGISVSSVYYVGRGEISIRQALTSGLVVAALVSGIGLAIGGTIVAWWGHKFFPDVSPAVLWVALAYFPLLLVRTILAGLLQAAEDFRSYNRLIVVEFLGTLLLTFAALRWWQATPQAAMLAVCAGILLTVFVSSWSVARHCAADERPHLPNYTRQSLRYGWKANVSNVLAYLNYRVDVLLVGYFVGAAGAGIYAATLVLSERLWALSQAVSTVTFPRLASLHATPDKANSITEQTSRCVLVVTLLASLGIAAVAQPLLSLVYGTAFGTGATALVILLPGCIVASATRILANSLAAAGRVGWNAAAAALLLVVDVLANLVLLPRFGICGAAFASTLAWLVHGALIVCLYAKLHRRAWWLPLIPQQSDWDAIVRSAMRGAQRANEIQSDVKARFGEYRIARRQTAAKLAVSVLVGILLTSYLEDRETLLLQPIRNWIVLGTTHSRSDSLFGPSRYKHASGVNPVHVAQTVRPLTLRVLASCERGDHVERTAVHNDLLRVADYFVAAGVEGTANGTRFRVWQYEFDYPYYGITQPWRSGMAQGHAIEVLLAVYRLTQRDVYLATAKEAANALAVPIDQGGTAVVVGPGIWFEEYASESCRPPEVLNGHNFALNGLWHLAQLEPRYRDLFDQGVTALKDRLPQYDKGVWSHYDRQGTPANRKYHKIHCEQLRELYARTGDPLLNRYAEKFETQLALPLHVFYRLCAYPTRLLCALVVVNSLAAWLTVESVAYGLQKRKAMSLAFSAVTLAKPASNGTAAA